MKTIGQRLVAAMAELDVGPSELERRSGVPKGNISKLCHDQRRSPAPQTLERLADALGVSYEWLALGRGDKPARVPPSARAETEIESLCSELRLSSELKIAAMAAAALGATAAEIRYVYATLEHHTSAMTSDQFREEIMREHEFRKRWPLAARLQGAPRPLRGREMRDDEALPPQSISDGISAARRAQKKPQKH